MGIHGISTYNTVLKAKGSAGVTVGEKSRRDEAYMYHDST